MEKAIEEFFLANGKWELDITPEGNPRVIAGRWLWLSDANYGFRAVDLIAAMNKPSDTK